MVKSVLGMLGYSVPLVAEASIVRTAWLGRGGRGTKGGLCVSS
jgi:hypothetical protein